MACLLPLLAGGGVQAALQTISRSPIHEAPSPYRKPLPHDQHRQRANPVQPARRGEEAARGEGAAWGRAPGRVLLAARRQARGQGDARLSGGRERLRRYVLAPLKPVQGKLYDEIVARIKQDDASVPFRERGWWYYSRFEAGKDYPIHARRKDAAGIDAGAILKANEAADFASEEVLLDVNAMATGKDYYAVSGRTVSQDNRCWPMPTTPMAAASTPCGSRTCRPARCWTMPFPALPATACGPTTTGRSSTSRTIRKPCSAPR
jgi:hypothetical protein